jgi:hypothetical protein
MFTPATNQPHPRRIKFVTAVMYVSAAIVVVTSLYIGLISKPGGYSEDEVGAGLFYLLLGLFIVLPAGLIALSSSLLVLIRKKHAKDNHYFFMFCLAFSVNP